MRWRFILACALIVLILCGGISALSYTTKLYNQMLGLLDAAGSSEPDGDALREAHALWEKNLLLLSTLNGDAHVDVINHGFARALQFAGISEAPHEYLAAVTDLISGIKHLRDYDRPSLRSIF